MEAAAEEGVAAIWEAGSGPDLVAAVGPHAISTTIDFQGGSERLLSQLWGLIDLIENASERFASERLLVCSESGHDPVEVHAAVNAQATVATARFPETLMTECVWSQGVGRAGGGAAGCVMMSWCTIGARTGTKVTTSCRSPCPPHTRARARVRRRRPRTVPSSFLLPWPRSSSTRCALLGLARPYSYLQRPSPREVDLAGPF